MKDIKDNKIRLKIVTISYMIYSIFTILFWSQLQTKIPHFVSVYYVIEVLCIISLFLCCLLFRNKTSTLIIDIFLFLYSLLTIIISNNFIFGMFVFFFLASKGIDYSKVIEKSIWVNISLLGLIISLWKFGFLHNDMYYRDTGMIRQTLGFNYPTLLMYLIMVIGIEWILIRKSKISFFELLIIFVLSYYFGKLTDARAETFLLYYLCILGVIIKIIGKNIVSNIFDNKVVKLFCTLFPEIICVLSYLFTISITTYNPLYPIVNNILSNRLTFFQFFLKNYGVKLFPIRLEVPYTNMPTVIDNLNLYLGINLGLVNLIIYLVITSLLIKKALERKDVFLLIIVLPLVVLNFSEYAVICPVVAMYCLSNTNVKNKNTFN